MIQKEKMIFKLLRYISLIFVIALGIITIVATGGNNGGGGDETDVIGLDIEPFIELAENADCTDIRNKLYVIDDELVFWDRAGSCPDNSFEFQLYGDTIEDLLCEEYDSVDGPQRVIYDEDFTDFFDLLIEHAEDENLGLDDTHTVEEVNVPQIIQDEFIYEFLSDAEGWVGDFADYPYKTEDSYELMFEYSMLPYPLDETKGSLKISGNNHSDDLFMFVKRKISGLGPLTSYQLIFNVEFASNVADGMVGIGGSPGEDVTLKAGATQIEPMKELDAYDNFYRMNIDKSNQSQGGEDMIVIGDFSNDTNQNIYSLKIVTNQVPFQVQANNDGELWIVVGTDSGFEGTTTIFYNKIEVILN